MQNPFARLRSRFSHPDVAILGIAAVLSLISCPSLAADAAPASIWPSPSSQNKPWTRWWWLGSGVDKANLTRELEAFAKAGMGGVEICPIYGAKGAEDRFIDFLSPQWMEMLAHTTSEAKRLGMQVDLTTGTGWPFGGPMVKTDTASKALRRIQVETTGGKVVSLKLPEGELQCLLAFPESGKPVDLTKFAKQGKLEWTPPDAGTWTVSGISMQAGIQKVKRAAPGGEGFVLDPFSPASINSYTASFDAAFKGFKAPMPRAQFHDSFEYYGADWTPELLAAFENNRGYDLREKLPAFNGKGDKETVARVRSDYRETLGELHRSYLKGWHDWAQKHGGITRNQAHGSPGNLLDHYAVSEIPETEIFRHVGDDQIPMLRFAASAAHSNGGTLVSSETFTWLGEHFQVTPATLKEAADFVFLGGVNHVFFHGIPYSPEGSTWPGWLFYASTHMGPNGGLWQDLPAFNGYLQRCQSILQNGTPDSEVLVYFPFADTIADGAEKLPLFTIHNQNEWLHTTPFYQSAMEMWNKGITFDFASDDMLKRATVRNGKIILGNNEFKVLVIPKNERMPHSTMMDLTRLSVAGGKVVFKDGLPSKMPDDLRLPALESGKIEIIKGSLSDSLIQKGVNHESLVASGLRFVRRKHGDGYNYFIVNRSGKAFKDTVKLSKTFKSAVVLNPWRPDNIGVVTSDKIPLNLAPLESIIIRTFDDRSIEGEPWALAAEGTATEISGPWKIEFTSGGPELPKAAELAKTAAWTTLEDPAVKNFSGTARYASTFEFKEKAGTKVSLNLGKVAQTARVFLNGSVVGVSWCPPHVLDLTKQIKPGVNELAIEVTSLAANRIADLDRRKVDWKRFHEINFVNIDYKPFDASTWPMMESGLIGPVRLIVGNE